jgi:hypothetical protein
MLEIRGQVPRHLAVVTDDAVGGDGGDQSDWWVVAVRHYMTISRSSDYQPLLRFNRKWNTVCKTKIGGGAEVFTDALLLYLYLWPPSAWFSKLKNIGQPAVH